MDCETVASFLIEQELHLTALEMHTELLERNKRVEQLEQFTEQLESSTRQESNGNADLARAMESRLSSRVGSQATLDSQSLLEARYSVSEADSGQREQDRVAVLEFELRRANELIQSLRAELQQALEVSKSEENDANEDENDLNELSVSQTKALNFVVHEYLLLRNFRMTAITFSEENSDQDLDEWEEMQPRPTPLHKLYTASHTVKTSSPITVDACNQAMLVDISELESRSQLLLENKLGLEEEVESLREQLQCKNEELEGKNEEIEQLELKQKRHLALIGAKDSNHEVNNKIKINEENVEEEKREEFDNDIKYNNEIIKDDHKDDEEQCTASEPFATLMKELCLPFKDTITTDKIDIHSDKDEENDVLEVLVEHIPRVVPNVIVAKRDELIPLLLVVINRHCRSETRDAFLHILFNLIKRPDAQQRRVIISGFSRMASLLGSKSLECELLPQCWEQIGHKYEERRILVAETIAVIAPSVPSRLRMSLLLSMASQMAMEDRDMEVRIAAIRALAILVLHGLHDKFENVSANTAVLLKDPCRKIVQRTQETLLLSLAEWSLRLGVLESRLLTERVSDLSKQAELAEDEDDLIFYVMEDKLEAINMLVPFLFASIVRSSPHNQPENVAASNEDGNKQSKKDAFEERNEENSLKNQGKTSKKIINVQALLGSEQVWSEFQSILSREWFPSWPQLQWLRTYFLKELSSILARLTRFMALGVLGDDDDFGGIRIESDVRKRTVSLLRSMVDLLTSLTLHMGRNLAQNELWAGLKELTREKQSHFNHGLVVVAVLGVAKLVFCPEQVCDIVERWILDMVENDEENLFETEVMPAMLFVVDELLNERADMYKDAMAELGWKWLVHQHRPERTRRASALLFVRLLLHVHRCDASLLESKLLPGLVTLSSDADASIRLHALPGLVFLVAHDIGAVQERALLQTLTFLEPNQNQSSYLKSIALFKHFWPHFPARIREEFILKHVFECYNKEGGEEQRAELATALIDLAQTIASHNLSVNCVHDHLMPYIELLRTDVAQILPALDDQVRAIANRLQSIYGPRRTINHNSVDQPRGMSQSASMENVRQRMGKFLQRPAVSQVQFWRK